MGALIIMTRRAARVGPPRQRRARRDTGGALEDVGDARAADAAPSAGFVGAL
jgi:hypothetical protein